MHLATQGKQEQKSSNVAVGEIIRSGEVSCYTIPTDAPEADGTFRWHQTTLVAVHLTAGDKVGFGYTYADISTGALARTLITEVARGRNALDV